MLKAKLVFHIYYSITGQQYTLEYIAKSYRTKSSFVWWGLVVCLAHCSAGEKLWAVSRLVYDKKGHFWGFRNLGRFLIDPNAKFLLPTLRYIFITLIFAFISKESINLMPKSSRLSFLTLINDNFVDKSYNQNELYIAIWFACLI